MSLKTEKRKIISEVSLYFILIESIIHIIWGFTVNFNYINLKIVIVLFLIPVISISAFFNLTYFLENPFARYWRRPMGFDEKSYSKVEISKINFIINVTRKITYLILFPLAIIQIFSILIFSSYFVFGISCILTIILFSYSIIYVYKLNLENIPIDIEINGLICPLCKNIISFEEDMCKFCGNSIQKY